MFCQFKTNFLINIHHLSVIKCKLSDILEDGESNAIHMELEFKLD